LDPRERTDKMPNLLNSDCTIFSFSCIIYLEKESEAFLATYLTALLNPEGILKARELVLMLGNERRKELILVM